MNRVKTQKERLHSSLPSMSSLPQLPDLPSPSSPSIYDTMLGSPYSPAVTRSPSPPRTSLPPPPVPPAQESPHSSTVGHIVIQMDAATNTDVPNENWTGANLETLSQWIQISCLQIEVLDLAIKYFRSIVRKNVLLGLVFSTASGSISLSQMNSPDQRIIFNVIFTIMSFSIAIFTGLIKIYQIQERLEEFIQLKQEWIGFSVVITTEVQLPVGERAMALELISKNKNKYLDLLKHDVDIPNFIKSRANKNLYHDKEQYLKNLEKYKRLRDIWCCTDDPSFLKSADSMLNEKDDTVAIDEPSPQCTYSNCWCICGENIAKLYLEVYRYFFINKDKYVGEKTALANIILKVIMEEENEQRAKDILRLLNKIKDRKRKLEDHSKKETEEATKFGVTIKNGSMKMDQQMMTS